MGALEEDGLRKSCETCIETTVLHVRFMYHSLDMINEINGLARFAEPFFFFDT